MSGDLYPLRSPRRWLAFIVTVGIGLWLLIVTLCGCACRTAPPPKAPPVKDGYMKCGGGRCVPGLDPDADKPECEIPPR